MDIEDDDAFLYGESSPPPSTAPEIQPAKVEEPATPNVESTRSSFPLVLTHISDFSASTVPTPASGLSAAMAA
jgi:hypothetical protein